MITTFSGRFSDWRNNNHCSTLGCQDNDFNRAQSKARTSWFRSYLNGERDDLLPFEETRQLVQPSSELYAGLQTVRIDRIVGNERRRQDFNIKFLPHRGCLRGRWESINRAHHEQNYLPPVNLYELGGVYFVRDGNLRVSVARTRGQAFIDAEVVRLATSVSLLLWMSLDDVRKAANGKDHLRAAELSVDCAGVNGARRAR